MPAIVQLFRPPGGDNRGGGVSSAAPRAANGFGFARAAGGDIVEITRSGSVVQRNPVAVV